MFTHTKSQVYFRDKFVPFADAHLSLDSSPVLYGLSIYTTISTHWDASSKTQIVFRPKDHFERLVNSAQILDFGQFVEGWDYERFEKMLAQLIAKNSAECDLLLRVSVFVDENLAGTKIHGLTNSVSAFAYRATEFLPLSGIHACVSSWVRTPDNAIPSRAKVNGSYVNASLMKNEAILNGYDEAIALDQHGHVTESTVANLFLIKNGVMITPEATSDMLEGITRSTVITMANELGLPVEIRAVDRSELYTADEMFLSGSSAYITPVLSVDKRSVGKGSIGDLTKKLTAAYTQLREDAASSHPEWRLLISEG